LKIRQASVSDFSEIKKLIKQYPDKLMQSPLPKVKEFLVAEVQGKLVGCCALEVYSKRLAEVRSLVVKENFQRRGIGTKLVKACLKRAKKEKIYEVLSVTGAVELFGNLGFGTFNKEKYAMLKIVK
jgi:amino-acid N-acetyltransferase